MGKKQRATKISKTSKARAGVNRAGQKIRQKAKGKPGRAKATPYHKNLGPMGELGWDYVIVVEITDDLKKYNVRELNYKAARIALENIVYDPLREYLMGPGRGGVSGLINTLAPRDTGALREALERGVELGLPSLDDFEGKTGPFEIKLGTPEIEYAKPVNKMPMNWLRHPHGSGKGANIGRSGKKLNDPDARTGWYNLTLLNGRNKAKRLYNQFINQIVSIIAPLKSTYNLKNLATKLFKARFK